METPLELRPQATTEKHWSGNSAHGSAEQYNGDYHNNQRHYYICCYFGTGDQIPLAELWNRFKRWFGAHHPWTTSGVVFIVLTILVASITPPVYYAIQKTGASTTVAYWDNVLPTCNRNDRMIYPMDRCGTKLVYVVEKMFIVPCWPDGKCCTAAYLERWTLREDGMCAPSLECRTKMEDTKLVSSCGAPVSTDTTESTKMLTAPPVTPARVEVEVVTPA